MRRWGTARPGALRQSRPLLTLSTTNTQLTTGARVSARPPPCLARALTPPWRNWHVGTLTSCCVVFQHLNVLSQHSGTILESSHFRLLVTAAACRRPFLWVDQCLNYYYYATLSLLCLPLSISQHCRWGFKCWSLFYLFKLLLYKPLTFRLVLETMPKIVLFEVLKVLI